MIGQLAPTKHKKLTIGTKRNLIQSIFISTLCDQSQTLTLTSSHSRRLVTAMKCSRTALGLTIIDGTRNEITRDSVRTESVLNYIQIQQVKWVPTWRERPVIQYRTGFIAEQVKGSQAEADQEQDGRITSHEPYTRIQ